MFPASSVVARLSELMTDPKSSKFVLISTGKLLSCIIADGKRLNKKTQKTATSAEIKEQAKVHTHRLNYCSTDACSSDTYVICVQQ